jgi:Mg-chelatase subunit ChlD
VNTPLLHCVLSDGYDREVFAQALRREPALRAVLERAARLLPHAEPLMCDLFAALFKLNVVLLPPDEVAASVLVNRRLLQSVAASEALSRLRASTQLDEVRSGEALVVLAGHVLAALTRDHRVLDRELVRMADVAHDEATLAVREQELDHLRDLPPGAFDDEVRARLEDGLRREVADLRSRIERGRTEQSVLAASLPGDIDGEIDRRIAGLDEQLAEIDASLRSFGFGPGGDGRVEASRRLELGRRLLESRKLQLLARLLGAFRDVAFEARRKRVSRAPQELHQVRMGADVGRLLPSELLGLSRERRGLRLDFLRRLLEEELLQYEIEGASERGPMVLCVDGSGSMSGSKELWAKAVALTLMEIARRQRRRALALVFSDGHELFEVELLGAKRRGRGRAPVLDEQVLRFAEHFPGGGTSFEEPLRRALDAVAPGERYRRGDVVFITDGEAQVSPDLVDEVRRRRKKHRFRIRGILVDVREARAATLERFCDDVRCVTDLTADSLADLFAAV